MREEIIEGVGSVWGGEYDLVKVSGMGKLKHGDMKTSELHVEGMFKAKGDVTADELHIEGMARFFRKVKAKKLHTEGLIKVRRANVSAGELVAEGVIVCTGEISADNAYINGIVSAASLVGDKITVEFTDNIKIDAAGVKYIKHIPSKLYFGRKLSLTHSDVGLVECTSLTASRLHAKTVRAQKVVLRDGCVIDELVCPDVDSDETCTIKKIIKA